MKKIIFLLMILIVLSSCKTTPARQALNLSLMTSEQPIKAFVIFSQEELNAIVPVQNSTGVSAQFGLIGAVVGGAIDASANSSTAQTTESNLAPIRNKLLDFKFERNIENKADVAFQKSDKVVVSPFTLVRNDGLVSSRVVLGETFITIALKYQLTEDFRAPTIIARARMAIKGNGAKNDIILYANDLHYTGRILHLSPEKFERRKKLQTWLTSSYAYIWANSHSQQLISDLESGVTELLGLIVKDLDDLETSKSYENKSATSRKYGFNPTHRSTLISDTNNRVVIRSAKGRNSGAICSFSGEISKIEEQYCIF